MATSYEAWAKFDVDAELERVDLQAQREEQHRLVQKQQCAKQSVEDAVSTSAEQSAEVLAAHAAVAALKAKCRAKKKQSAGVAAANGGDNAGDNDTKGGLLSEHTAASSNQTDVNKQEESVAERLQRQSGLFKKKHELIKQIMEHRREGEAILAQGGEEKRRNVDPDTSREQRALRSFENALTFVQELEKIAPDLILAEREQSVRRGTSEVYVGSESIVRDTSTAGTVSGGDHSFHHHDSRDGHSCGGDTSQCAHAKKNKNKTDKDALPKVNDLEAILRMFFKDVCMGIGACHLQGNRLAAASNAFKDVLLRDDAHVAAWLERGNAFERMGADLLAMLHFNRATALVCGVIAKYFRADVVGWYANLRLCMQDANDEDAKESLDRVKETLLSGLDDIIGADAIKRKVESLTQQCSLLSILNSIHLVFQEANVLMIEGFSQYAIPKYRIVLGSIEFLLDEKPELVGADEVIQNEAAAEIQTSLKQLRTSCRLNIAGGYHEMQKNQLKAVEYCEDVLASDAADRSVQAICHFRIGQLFRSAHGYERAMDHLELSRKLMTAHPAPEAQQQHQHEQRIDTLKKIDKEIDRCGFERSQHDLAYIRSLLELNAAGSTSPSPSPMSV